MNKLAQPHALRSPSPEFLDELARHFGDRFSTAHAVRDHHGRDESPFPPMLPDAVVFAQSTDDVAWLAQRCHEHKVPLIPYGVGSSLEGHILAIQGGISVDLSGMSQIVAVNAEDFTATVQAGVTRTQLNEHLRDTGLFFPVDPGADASIGGMCSTRASGTNAVRYGTMRENVVSLKAVMANGDIITTGRRAKKSAAGYDLTHLFVGAEGTLGVIVEATVRLHPLPESTMAAVCAFPDIDAAVQAVVQIIQLGVPVARCEFVDPVAIKALNQYSNTGLPMQPHLFFEFHGSESGLQEQIELVQDITGECGAAGFVWSSTPEA